MGVASSSVMVGAESIIPLKTPSPAQMPIIPIAMTHKSSTLEKVSRHLRPSFEDVDWSAFFFLFYTLFAMNSCNETSLVLDITSPDYSKSGQVNKGFSAILRYCSQKEMLLYWLGSGKRLSADR